VICIGKEHQGKGYCKLALQPFLDQVKEKIVLSVLKTNIAAIKCYEHVGFKPITLTKTEAAILEDWNPQDTTYMWMRY
jgi:RimJ/RimL family protein N-acetyltransferase